MKGERTIAEPVRLQKVMARAGIGSRRACEALIEEGRVAVDGEVVKRLPVLVTPGVEQITVDGEAIERYMPKAMRREFGRTGEASAGPFVYVALNKPRQTLTTMADPDHRRTVADLVEHPSGIRLYPVGRLDYDTLGLVLMTNDGELANRLTHPRFGVPKTYRAVLKGRLAPEQAEALRGGTYLSERKRGRTVGASRTRGIDLRIVKAERERTVIDLTLKEGRNRQVRRMLAKVGCPVRKLTRTAMGPITLKDLKPGEWRDLSPQEVRKLKESVASTRGTSGLDGRSRDRKGARAMLTTSAPLPHGRGSDALSHGRGSDRRRVRA